MVKWNKRKASQSANHKEFCFIIKVLIVDHQLYA